MEIMKKIVLILTIIGALNWGLIGLLDLNLVTLLIKNSMIINIIYMIIGICALVSVIYLFDDKKDLHE